MKTDLCSQQVGDWPTASLESICTTITSGGTPKRLTPGYYTGSGGIPWVRTQELQDAVIYETEEHITELAITESSAKRLPKGTLLMAMYAAPTAGRMAILGREMACNQAACAFVFDPTRADTRYMFYQLLQARPDLHRLANGAAQQNLSGRVLRELEVLVPPLEEQRRIAGVLGALDDLIEVNRGLATDLRDLTRAAFDRLQGGATRSTTLGELINLQYGKALPATQRRTGRYPVVSSAGIVDSHDIGLVEGPGVVVGRKGTVGSVTWVDSDFFPIDTAFYVESKLPLLYVYWLLKSQDLASMNTDSAVPGLNRENALSLRVDQPDDEAMWEFVTSASPLWSAARDLEAEIRELASTRDELLPLLMSGRVRVAEIVAA